MDDCFDNMKEPSQKYTCCIFEPSLDNKLRNVKLYQPYDGSKFGDHKLRWKSLLKPRYCIRSIFAPNRCSAQPQLGKIYINYKKDCILENMYLIWMTDIFVFGIGCSLNRCRGG